MLQELLLALSNLDELDTEELLEELEPDELRELCKYRALIRFLLAYCERRGK